MAGEYIHSQQLWSPAQDQSRKVSSTDGEGVPETPPKLKRYWQLVAAERGGC